MRKMFIALALLAVSAAVFAQAPAAPKDVAAGQGPQAAKAALTSVTGVLAFVDDRPAVKTDSGAVFLAMPDFYKYAYEDGIKAGAAIKAVGMLMSQADAKDGKATLVVKELSVGSRTYIVVGGTPDGRAPFGGPMPGPQGNQPSDQPKAPGEPSKADKF